MREIMIRDGLSEEWAAIAQLHSQSWQVAYRNILSDDFLDNQVLENRMQYWEKRLQAGIPNNTFLRIAEHRDQLVGLVCAVAGVDQKWGTLVDNLHVLPEAQQRGLGRQLMQEAARWVLTRPGINMPSAAPMHLWVYRENTRACTFYEKVHGSPVEEKAELQPDGQVTAIVRYAWSIDAAKKLIGS